MNVLFHRNCIQTCIRKEGDLEFIGSISDQYILYDYMNRYNITRDDICGHVFTKKVKIEKEIKFKELTSNYYKAFYLKL